MTTAPNPFEGLDDAQQVFPGPHNQQLQFLLIPIPDSPVGPHVLMRVHTNVGTMEYWMKPEQSIGIGQGLIEVGTSVKTGLILPPGTKGKRNEYPYQNMPETD